MLTIAIKYHDPDLIRLEKIDKGDWIDLRSAEEVTMWAGQYRLISLGVSMELPEGYEAHMAPRSSTYKNFGVIQVNSPGIIDCSYKGTNDIWRFPAYALRDTKISKNDRICQFRIIERMPTVSFIEVEDLGNENRGGFGTTGVK